jgi:hypothetical protein
VLDQEVAAARAIAEQPGDLMCRIGIDLAALRHRPGAAAAFAWMVEVPDLVDASVCVLVFLAHRALLLRPRAGAYGQIV